MIAKVTSGGGFRGVLDYLMNQKKQHRGLGKKSRKNCEATAGNGVRNDAGDGDGAYRITLHKRDKSAVANT